MTRSTPANRPICTLALTVATTMFAFVAPALAQDNVYYHASMCIGVDEFGEPWSAIRFADGVASNFSDGNTRYLVCPVPYVRDLENPAVIVRVSGLDNTDDGRLRVQLCEKPLDTVALEPATCHDSASTSNGSIGFTTLEASFIPDSSTRWVYLRIEIPDSDAQSGRSYVSGYRVCRGSC